MGKSPVKRAFLKAFAENKRKKKMWKNDMEEKWFYRDRLASASGGFTDNDLTITT